MNRFSILVVALAAMLPATIHAVPYPAESPDFGDIVRKAIASGEKNIVLEKGVYKLALPNGEPLTLEGLDGICIDGNGSEIITDKGSQAIQITGCRNMVLKNFSIDCAELPFTQGEIIDMDTEKRMWWDVRIMDGYPVKQLFEEIPDRVQVFDPVTLELRKNLYSYWKSMFASVEHKEGNVFRFTKNRFNPDSNEEIGDFLTMTINAGKNTRPHSIVLYRSENIRLENITIWSGNCFGFFEDQCSSNSYYGCVIDRKPYDPDLSFPRLRAINADAFHSKAARRGPVVENCIFRHHADDCIAINTGFHKIIRVGKSYIDVLSRHIKMMPGDTLRFVTYQGAIAGDAVLKRIESRDKDGKVARLHIDRPVAVDTGGVVSSITRGGNGYVLRNNVLGFTRARGILIKASDGIIENNEVRGCELGGIVLAPELNWMEATFAWNVSITDNVIIDCMFANSSYGIEQAAPLCVVAINAENNVVPAGGFRNITIKDNKIINSPQPAMILAAMDSSVVTGNIMTISKDVVRNHGKILKSGQEGKPVWMINNGDIKFENNIIVE